jgi:hypothetical protein
MNDPIDTWVVYLDVFGFKAMLDSSSADDLCARLGQGHELLKRQIDGREPRVHSRLISDSIFLIYEVDSPTNAATVLKHCLEDLPWLMSTFVNLKLPLRGGMARGEIHLEDDLLVGRPVARAVKYESMIAAPFVFLPRLELKDLGGHEPSGVAPIPVKGGGLVSGLLVRPHPSDGLVRLAREAAQHHLTYGPPDIARIWFEALSVIEGG